ncbi:hypothetical protein FACS189461_4570 [Spirochaetia bacterium]|nr:hypothetical protein FACS189461_4570 [Spirochaetia bacterium]
MAKITRGQMDSGEMIGYKYVESKLVTIREQQIIIDSDVADMYGVETKEINQAVKNNPEKFPVGYIFEVALAEKNELVKIFDRFRTLKHSSVLPKAFTEKGLYMLATILRSPRATATTIAIVETFSKIRELSKLVTLLPKTTGKNEQKSLMQKSGEIIAELLDNDLETSETETSFEIDLAVMKFKHIIKKKTKTNEDNGK